MLIEVLVDGRSTQVKWVNDRKEMNEVGWSYREDYPPNVVVAVRVIVQ